MSNRALTWAFAQPVKKAGAKLVLVALADGASNHDFTSYPGQELLARMTSQSVSSVRRHLKDLEDARLIQRTRRKRKDGSRTSDLYELAVNHPEWSRKPTPDDGPDGDGAPTDDVPANTQVTLESHRSNCTVSPGDLFGDHQEPYRSNCTTLPVKLTGEPLGEPSGSPSGKPSGDPGAPNGGADPPATLKAQLFGSCLRWLADQVGKQPDQLRSLVGRWCRDHGDGRVLEAFEQAERCSPVDPKAWIESRLKGRNANGPTDTARAVAGIRGYPIEEPELEPQSDTAQAVAGIRAAAGLNQDRSNGQDTGP